MIDENEYLHPPHAPRSREHIGLIRWRRNANGDWECETVTGQFAKGDSHRWVVRLYSGIELEYDLTTLSPYKPTL